jgi:hypothetical protein
VHEVALGKTSMLPVLVNKSQTLYKPEAKLHGTRRQETMEIINFISRTEKAAANEIEEYYITSTIWLYFKYLDNN